MASKKWYSKVEDACEAIGWSVASPIRGGYEWEFEITTPAGEDYVVYIYARNLPELKGELQAFYADFDREEYVYSLLREKRNGLKGVPDLDSLVKDSHEIEDMLGKLVLAVTKIN